MTSNPYYEHALLVDASMFYGREQEISKLCELLSKKQSISIIGQRRIGKSTLLYHLCREETHSKYLENWRTYVFVYINLREISESGVSGFFLSASEEILKASGTRCNTNQTAIQDYRGFRNLVGEFVSAGLTIVLCMDEFERLTTSKDPEINGKFFGFLRTLADQHRLLLITSSREPLHKICQTGDIPESAFHNIFTPLNLGLIPVRDARRLIIEPAERNGLKFSDTDIEFVLSNAGTYPLFIQRACFHLFEQYKIHQPGSLDYDAIRNSLYNEAVPYLEDIWKYLEQEEVLLLMGELINVSELARRKIMDNLKNKGLLDEKYLKFSMIFEEFIKEKRSTRITSKHSPAPTTTIAPITTNDPVEQLFALQFGSNNILVLELRGKIDYRETLDVTLWNLKDVEDFRSRARDLYETRNWRPFVNSIGKDIFGKFSQSGKIVSTFNNAFPYKTDRTRIVFRIPRDFITLPLEWMITYDIPTLSDQIPLTILCPVSKYITGIIRKHHPLPTGFVSDPNKRMLFIASNVSGKVNRSKDILSLVSIDQVDIEITSIENLFKQGQADGIIKCNAKFIHTGELSSNEIIKEMASGYDWIHYAGHSWYDVNNPENSSLFFYTEKGNKEKITCITASEMNRIAGDGDLKGIYLSSCTGAYSASATSLVYEDFLGIMDALVVANVPTIIGMRWPIPDVSAHLLASEFYKALFAGIPTDYALYLAKRAVYFQNQHDQTWASPILIHQVP